MEELFGGVLGFLSVRRWVHRRNKRRAQRLRESSTVECSLRSAEASPLLRRWRAGLATVKPGAMDFVPYVALGFRVRRPRTSSIQIEVLAIAEDLRTPEGREHGVVAGLIAEVQSVDFTVELALGDQNSLWAIEALAPSPDGCAVEHD